MQGADCACEGGVRGVALALSTLTGQPLHTMQAAVARGLRHQGPCWGDTSRLRIMTQQGKRASRSVYSKVNHVG